MKDCFLHYREDEIWQANHTITQSKARWMFWCWTNNNFIKMQKLYFFKVRNTPLSYLGMSFANYWLYKKISRKAPWLFWGASENLHSAAGLFPHNSSFRPLLYLHEEPCLLVWLLRSQNLFAIFRNDKNSMGGSHQHSHYHGLHHQGQISQKNWPK